MFIELAFLLGSLKHGPLVLVNTALDRFVDHLLQLGVAGSIRNGIDGLDCHQALALHDKSALLRLGLERKAHID